MEAYVDITRADGRSERRRIEGVQMTIGSSPEASIYIDDAPEIAPMHLLLAPRDEGCWVANAKGATPAPLLKGTVFENGMVPWGTELDVGSITLRISNTDLDDRAERRGRRMRLAILMLAIIAGLLWLMSGTEDRPPQRPSEAPELFAGLAQACPDGPPAATQGDEAAQDAFARIQRYPFDAQDGIRAVELLAVAERCYASAGQGADEAAARAQRDRITARIEEDYLAHRVRLERALAQRRVKDALIETRFLRGLIAHLPGTYLDWLGQLDRYLTLKLESVKTKVSL